MIYDERTRSEFQLACDAKETVLIYGQTGTGKTTLAKEIHSQSERAKGPFVSYNLASVHAGTIESELFGHERGAFTGADRRRIGRLQEADGGTLFLDEIGEMPLDLQAKLLEFLHSKTITPLGASGAITLNVRVIAATHQNLKQKVRKGTFRADLFYRLRVIVLELPSLKNLGEGFGVWVHRVLQDVTKELKKPVLRIEDDMARALETYSWPGNLRELRNTLLYSVYKMPGNVLTSEYLPHWFGEAIEKIDESDPALDLSRNPTSGEVPPTHCFTGDYYENLARFEKTLIIWALDQCQGRVGKTAQRLGISRSTLLRRIRSHRIGK